MLQRQLVGAKGDAISVVEACYQLRSDEETWWLELATAIQALPLAHSLGTLAYHVWEHDDGYEFSSPVQVGGEHDVVARISRMGRILQRQRQGTVGVAERVCARIYEAVISTTKDLRPDQMLIDEYRRFGPRWMYTLGVPKARDVMILVNRHIDGLGTTIVARGLTEPGKLQPAERRMYQMLGAHIKAGFRLRERLRRAPSSLATEHAGAVLDGTNMRVLHADEDAQPRLAREAIQEAAIAVDRARARQSGRDERALEVWQGLIDGHWSLVEHIDTDGKRLILAHRNAERARDPRALTQMEARVAALAVRGYSNKLIAYHLGVSESTVSAHLHRSCRKLRVAGRVELLRIMGPTVS